MRKSGDQAMRFQLLPNVTPPNIPMDNGYFPLWPASKLDEIDRTALRVWCHKNARYGLPTLELIEWLKRRFADSKVIEIGSGAGDFAYHLGIRATDNRCQEWPQVKQLYQTTKQPVIDYPEKVEELDALKAIEKYNPNIVFGSWLTQWIDPFLPPPKEGGSVYGIREDMIVHSGKTYILLGNLAIHGGKKIAQRYPHKHYALPFLRSRASQPELDRIFIWNDK